MPQHRNATARRSYNRVLLAAYWLSDAEGLACVATNAEIARAARVSVETVRSHLRALEADGTVAIYVDEGLPCRVVILLDHPEATLLVRKAERARRCPTRADRSYRLYSAFYGRLVKALA